MEKENESNQSNKKKPLEGYAKYSSLVIQMIATMCLGAWAGIKLDEHFHVKSQLFTIFLTIFSVIAAIYLVIRGLMK
ncbi:MAG: AtpZ/AtpI family protein [Sporocytophaga sp.]|uniref:AtpZ/AtpI family protein n=1 Tax=Sporocytophaga TaxID=1011 RepID=UPI001B2EC72A|nr:AtpZ/AtpI family protein [Sporocytophaga sp.]